MTITVLVAGTNEPSNCNVLADTFVQGIRMFDDTTTVHKKRLKDLNIKQFTVDHYDPLCHQEEDFCRLQHLIEDSDGLVIATPVWNFSVPGHLINCLDRMGSFALNEDRSNGTLHGLPFYVIFTGGAPYAAWNALMKKTTSHIPEALRYFGGSYIGHHFEGRCVHGKGKFGLVVDKRPKSLEEVRQKGFSFGQIVDAYKKTGKLPLRERTLAKVMRWGERLLNG
jgi:NAD(P)H-dependent FMN reductase